MPSSSPVPGKSRCECLSALNRMMTHAFVSRLPIPASVSRLRPNSDCFSRFHKSIAPRRAAMGVRVLGWPSAVSWSRSWVGVSASTALQTKAVRFGLRRVSMPVRRLCRQRGVPRPSCAASGYYTWMITSPTEPLLKGNSVSGASKSLVWTVERVPSIAFGQRIVKPVPTIWLSSTFKCRKWMASNLPWRSKPTGILLTPGWCCSVH